MGLDRFAKTPCGFCFVEYYTHQDALDCMKYIGGTKLDERIIRTDLDPGFQEGRQYGYDVLTKTFELLYLTFSKAGANLAVKSEMNTETNMIRAVEDTAAQLQMRDAEKKSNTGEVGNLCGFSYRRIRRKDSNILAFKIETSLYQIPKADGAETKQY